MYKPTIAEVKGGQEWSLLEQDLLDECKLGRLAYLLRKMDCPKDQSDPDRRVRAELIRYLLLGGCDNDGGLRPHPKGVQLRGAWIDGVLDFGGCTTRLNLVLLHCLMRDSVVFQDAKIGGLNLAGSRMAKGMNLLRLTTNKAVQLSYGFHASGLVDLGGARIGGKFFCDGGRFDGSGGKAINCELAQIGSDVAFRNGFIAHGEVNCRKVQIAGQFSCTGGQFEGDGEFSINCIASRIGAAVFLRDGFYAARPMSFWGSRIDGDFDVRHATLEGGLTLNFSTIAGRLLWLGLSDKVPLLDLTEAQVRVLWDVMPSWSKVEALYMSGFTYERIQSDTGIADRLDWLAGKHERDLPTKIKDALSAQNRLGEGKEFDPQPYTQLARVLESEGNRSDAAKVREVREDKLRYAARARAMGRADWQSCGAVATFPDDAKFYWGWVFKTLFGYGHQPMRVLKWMAGIWAVAFLLYSSVYAAGQMAPNSDVILTSADWLAIAKAYEPGGEMPMHAWLSTPAAKDYETFSAGLYALDLFLPLDALGQEAAWAPSLERGALGALGYWMRMPIQLAGWVITAVGAAVLTGLVGRKE